MRTHRFATPAALLVLLLLTSRDAHAQVTVAGDVLPADDPRTTFGDASQEGLPPAGNLLDFFFADADGNLADITGAFLGQPNYERNLNVIIGRNASGAVDIEGGAALRYGHLVLGGDESTDVSAVGDLINVLPTEAALETQTFGTGTLRIMDFGTVFNNHPNIVPAVFQDPADPETTFFAIPDTDFAFADGSGTFAGDTIARDPATGFDAYIGLTGNGVLEITNGGRAEIQDAVIIGYGTQASGLVTVSGVGSLLTNYGGLNPVSVSAVAASPVSQFIVGAYGSGELRIEDGGRVQALRGAAIGVTRSDGDQADTFPDTEDLEVGGNGAVIVSGPGSQWDIIVSDTDAATGGGESDESALAIGEFVSIENPMTLEPDYDESTAGQGSLLIENGGRVRVLEGASDRNNADVRVGRLGSLTLAGGDLEVRGDLFSDGQIAGSGEILTGSFVNRARGEVRVDAGETLSIRSNADEIDGFADINNPDLLGPFATAAAPTTPDTPTDGFGVNLGSIQIIGDENGVAEFEYERTDDAPAAGSTTELRFWNARRIAAVGAPPVEQAGEIIVNNGHLHFRTGPDLTGVNDGLRNDGLLAFVGGDNLVTGTVENTSLGEINITAAGAFDGAADGTFVTFADGLFNGGFVVLNTADVLTLPGSDAYAGSGTLSLIGGSSFTTQGTFRLGDGTAGGDLSLTTVNGVTPTLTVGGEFLIDTGATITIDGILTAAAGDTINVLNIQGLGTALLDAFLAPGTLTLDFSELSIAGPNLAAVPIVDANGISISVRDTTVPPTVAGDLTGDDVLDQDDLDLFGAFFGQESGGSIFTGDFTGDGAINGADFFFLQNLFAAAATPVVLPSSLATVPEPSAAGLAVLGLIVAARRRRRAN